MMIVIPLPAIGAGLLAALVYHAEANGWIYGVTAPFLPLLILAVAAMRYGRHGATTAGIAACLVLSLLWPPLLAITHSAAHIIPVTLFFRSLMVVAVDKQQQRIFWAPMGYAITIACMYSALFYLALGMTNNTLPLVLDQQMPADAAVVMEQVQKEMQHGAITTEQLTEIIVASQWCVDVLMLVLAARLAHHIMGMFGKAQRPLVHFTPYVPAHPVFFLLLLVWWVGLSSTGSLAHAARIAGIILLIPYAFSGIATLHSMVKRAYPARPMGILIGVYGLCIFIPPLGAAYMATTTLFGFYSYARISMTRLLLSR